MRKILKKAACLSICLCLSSTFPSETAYCLQRAVVSSHILASNGAANPYFRKGRKTYALSYLLKAGEAQLRSVSAQIIGPGNSKSLRVHNHKNKVIRFAVRLNVEFLDFDMRSDNTFYIIKNLRTQKYFLDRLDRGKLYLTLRPGEIADFAIQRVDDPTGLFEEKYKQLVNERRHFRESELDDLIKSFGGPRALKYSSFFAKEAQTPVIGKEKVREKLFELQKNGVISTSADIDKIVDSTLRFGELQHVDTLYASTIHFFAQGTDDKGEEVIYGICALHSTQKVQFFAWDRFAGALGSGNGWGTIEKITYVTGGHLASNIATSNADVRDYAIFSIPKKSMMLWRIPVVGLKPQVDPSGIGFCVGFTNGQMIMHFYAIRPEIDNSSAFKSINAYNFRHIKDNEGVGMSGSGLFRINEKGSAELVGASLRGPSEEYLRFTSSYAVIIDLLNLGRINLVRDIILSGSDLLASFKELFTPSKGGNGALTQERITVHPAEYSL